MQNPFQELWRESRFAKICSNVENCNAKAYLTVTLTTAAIGSTLKEEDVWYQDIQDRCYTSYDWKSKLYVKFIFFEKTSVNKVR